MAKNCRVPPSFKQAAHPSLPKGTISHGVKLSSAPGGSLRTSAPESQMPPTEGDPVPQRKQLAGM